MKLSDFNPEDVEEVKEETSKEKPLSLSDFNPEDIEEDEVTQGEAAWRGAVQGPTLDFADEIQAALRAEPGAGRLMSESLDVPISEIQEKEKKQLDSYEKLLEEYRKRDKEAREKYPATYIGSSVAGGILPALLTGGASAAGQLGKEVAKSAGKEVLKEGAEQSLKEAAKQATKMGAGYGAISGLGMSEEKDLGGLAKDTAIGGLIGGTTGAILPTAMSVGSSKLKGGTKAVKETLQDLIPGADKAAATYKYGRAGKELTEEVIDEDTRRLGAELLARIQKDKKEIGIDKVKQTLNEAGIVVDTTKEVNKAIDDLERLAAGDIFEDMSSKALQGLKKFRGDDLQSQKLAEKLDKSALKKSLQDVTKEEQAIIKGEKKLADTAFKTGDDLESVTDINRQMDDLEVPFDTSKGEFSGVKGSFKGRRIDPETGDEVIERYSKEVTSDTTPYQPTQVQTGVDPKTGRPFAVQKDLGTGKVTAIVGEIEDKIERDLANMTIDEVDNVIQRINSLTKVIKQQGYDDTDPVVRRMVKLAGDLREKTNLAIQKSGLDDATQLIEKRAKMSDIFSAEELTGISGRLSMRKDVDKALKEISLADKLGFGKGFKDRQETELAESLLAPQLSGGLGEEFKFMREINSILGREAANETITQSSLYTQAVGKLPNLAGRTVKKAVESKPYMLGKKLTSLPDESLRKIATLLDNISDPKMKQLFQPFINAVNNDNKVLRNAIIWSTSQQPATREAFRQVLSTAGDVILSNAQASELEREVPLMMRGVPYAESAAGLPPTPPDSSITPFIKPQEDEEEYNIPFNVFPKEEEGGLTPVDLNFMKEREGFSNEGYIPVIGKGKNYTATSGEGKISETSGVTIAGGLDLGQQGIEDIEKLEISDNIKQKLLPYLGKKGEEAKTLLQTIESPLELTQSEARELQHAVDKAYYIKAKTRFETNKYGRKFEDLPRPVRTALHSVNYHTGTIGPKTIEKAANDNNYEDLINEFRNYYRSPKMQEGFQGKRRQLEADYMEQQLQTLRGLQGRNPASEPVSEPPIAQPMDMAPEDLEREAARQEVDSTLQDVEDNMAPEERGQATQELQGELLRLHKMLATGGDDNIIAGMIDRIIPLVEKSVLNPQESQAMIYRLSQANPEDISNMIQELQVS